MKLFPVAQPLPHRERLMTHGMDEHLNDRQQRFLELFLPTRERLWRFVRALTHAGSDTVDEIMSETVFRAYQRFEHLRDESAFRAYCFRIARRVAGEMSKKSRRQPATAPESLAEYWSDRVQPDVSADVAILYDMLARLSPKLRETLVLFEISDCSLEDIRAIQGGTLSGVKSRLVRARSQLQSLMLDRQSNDVRATDNDSSSAIDSESSLYAEPPALQSSAS